MILGGLLPDLDSLRCNLLVQDGSKHRVQELQWCQLIHPPRTACILSPDGVAVHQEELKTHCTNIGSDNGSKGFHHDA